MEGIDIDVGKYLSFTREHVEIRVQYKNHQYEFIPSTHVGFGATFEKSGFTLENGYTIEEKKRHNGRRYYIIRHETEQTVSKSRLFDFIIVLGKLGFTFNIKEKTFAQQRAQKRGREQATITMDGDIPKKAIKRLTGLFDKINQPELFLKILRQIDDLQTILYVASLDVNTRRAFMNRNLWFRLSGLHKRNWDEFHRIGMTNDRYLYYASKVWEQLQNNEPLELTMTQSWDGGPTRGIHKEYITARCMLLPDSSIAIDILYGRPTIEDESKEEDEDFGYPYTDFIGPKRLYPTFKTLFGTLKGYPGYTTLDQTYDPYSPDDAEMNNELQNILLENEFYTFDPEEEDFGVSTIVPKGSRGGEITIWIQWIQDEEVLLFPSNDIITPIGAIYILLQYGLRLTKSENGLPIQSQCIESQCFLEATLKCSKCKSAQYCSTKCQANDWANHKNMCN